MTMTPTNVAALVAKARDYLSEWPLFGPAPDWLDNCLRDMADALEALQAERDADTTRLAFIEQEGGCHFDDGVWSFGGIDVQCRDLNTATDAARAIMEDVENES
jgi:hypothetical protein